MTWTWLTSTAIVALLVSTIIFGWQRSIEHQFLLRKEKRDHFRKINSSIVRSRKTIFEASFHESEEDNELQVSLYETSLICDDDTFDKLRDFIEAARSTSAVLGNSPKPGLEEQQKLIHDLGFKHAELNLYFKRELELTVFGGVKRSIANAILYARTKMKKFRMDK